MSKEIDYISFTGQQYIFSGVTVNGNSTIEITCAYTGTGSDTGAIFGSRTTESGTDSTSFTMFVVNGAIRIDHFGTSKTLDKNKYNPNGKHTYKITPDTVYCDGTKIYTHTVSSNSAPNKLHIGAVCTNGTISKLSNVNIYSFKFYDGSNLILNLIPYKDNNKKYCFKDLVNNKLYYSGAPEELKGFDSNNIKTGDILNFNYTGAVQSITLPKGIYTLECWGAQGGNRSQDSASATVTGSGLGGYSIGTLTLTQLTTCYIYVGGQGGMSSSTGNVKVEGGFNGGGFASHESTGEPGNGGGGATDVRIAQDSLYARVIVAGGGGGSGEDNETGGYGGGETGGAGSGNTSLTQASQTSGGTNSFGFGLGGNTYNGGAGGGGWYGGQGTYPDGSGDDDGGGGGGSGYVYTSSSASNYPQGCLLNSSYYLSDASNLSGNESFKSPSGTTETGHSDNGYCRITCYIKKKTLHCKMNNEIKKAAPVFMKMNNKIYDAGANAVMDFAYTGTAQAISLPRGKYTIECWGAQGGSYSSYYGGAGGYSVGTITLTKNSTDLYIYVGGQPEATTSTGETPGGFNGGGKGCSRTYNYSSYGQGGGGATDVRIEKNDLYARVIVAGGGGGSSSENSLTTKYGGGTTGGSSASGYGATQTAAGTNGSFGQGGSATTSGTNYNYGSGGGGGGWYGGGACSDYSDSTNYQGYNGGGSGYVYTSATAANYPSGNYVNSSYYLTNAQTIAGNQSFKSPDGTNETGHTGNGFCRITRKSGKIFVKQNGSWIKV